VVVFCTVTCVKDSRGFLGGAAKADETTKLVLPQKSPTKMVAAATVIITLKLAFIVIYLNK
jgi:hypothetical protein